MARPRAQTEKRSRAANSRLKAVLDRGMALGGLLACSPVMLGVAIAILAFEGRPVFFTQMRPGLRGEPFRLWKFRTMADITDAQGRELPDADRLTRVGRLLRSSSLDELPQLWNVVRGEMSLVGPRPLLLCYVPRYSAEQARRMEARPGITGWAQINGRNALSWDEKFQLDVWYVDNWTFWLDLKILVSTISRVLQRKGITNAESATMPEFMGREVRKS